MRFQRSLLILIFMTISAERGRVKPTGRVHTALQRAVLSMKSRV